jgi:hypothetical protein
MGARTPDERTAKIICLMSQQVRRFPGVFTVEQANATLPLVRAITTDLMTLSRELTERESRLAELVGGRRLRPGDPYADELLQTRKEMDRDLERLQGFVDELLELGVEPKNAVDGLIDFPSSVEGKPVYLCWRLGEPEIMYYHERDAGYSGRKPLPATMPRSHDRNERVVLQSR